MLSTTFLIKRLFILLIMLLLFIVTFLLSLHQGELKLTSGELIETFCGEKSGINYHIIVNIRLPRILLGAMVGSALAVSGAILQAVMRNPLAAPNLIGVSSGGGLAAVIIMVIMPQYLGILPLAAFSGSLLAALVVYALAWQNGIQPLQLVLSGIALASLLGALTTGLLILNADKAAGILDFTVGSLSAKTWKQPGLIWPYILTGGILACLLAKQLNILLLGDEIAANMGINVELLRLLAISIAALLAAATVAVVGLLGFVGLIVPHLVRLLIGSDYRYLLPACMIFGATLVMFCDTVSRLLLAPTELPVGLVTALLGAPFFLFLLRRRLSYDT